MRGMNFCISSVASVLIDALLKRAGEAKERQEFCVFNHWTEHTFRVTALVLIMIHIMCNDTQCLSHIAWKQLFSSTERLINQKRDPVGSAHLASAQAVDHAEGLLGGVGGDLLRKEERGVNAALGVDRATADIVLELQLHVFVR